MNQQEPSKRETQKERFTALLAPVRNRLAHYAFAMTRDGEEARDLVADTLLAAYERFASLNDEAAFLGYLFTIATRIHRRKRWRQRLFSRFDPEAAEAVHDRATPPDVAADIRLLYSAMAELPDAQREAVALFSISGCSIDEIRGIQGGSLSAVKMRLKRGRARLAELLGVGDDTPGDEPVAAARPLPESEALPRRARSIDGVAPRTRATSPTPLPAVAAAATGAFSVTLAGGSGDE